ncbi:glycoside hydrolase [Podospora australis]|uniref:beta-galactosidase n=1 Tax=Podospora australis TaxID=1536484 RepID=A0AAN6WRW6_9PEZI|nr:glycoside hydrolase [Podospora australis]
MSQGEVTSDVPGVVSSSDVKAGQAHVVPEDPDPLADWENLEVIHRNTLPPRAQFFLYDLERDARDRTVAASKSQLLSGDWLFNLSKAPAEGPIDFYERSFQDIVNDPDWTIVVVPGMWQLQGHGKGPQDDNECGRYLTEFQLDAHPDEQIRLRFEGVDAAFKVWVNDTEVGYSQGSRNPSEFDISQFVRHGDSNVLAVEVYQRCNGSYIEDQDQWWLSGIFRDVWLHVFPPTHFEDVHIQTILDDKYEDATLHVDLKLNSVANVKLKLWDINGKLMAEKTKAGEGWIGFDMPVDNPAKWTAEDPLLYQLVLSMPGCHLSERVGFRRVELLDGVFCVNGQPVKLRGVNRHEHHPDSGRAVPYEYMQQDLMLMKQHNINAIRTSHYMNEYRFYELADELGFWILDECDLECHGLFEVGGNGVDFTTNNPRWKQAYLDRARHMVMRDYNRPCIVLWSLGNESGFGSNFAAMYDYIKSVDKSRLIHYEGDYEAESADIESKMYHSVEDMERYAKERSWNKPVVLCEYIHAMGNGPGAIKEYIELFYRYPRLMGGFCLGVGKSCKSFGHISSNGLRTKTKDGREYMGYGGDFADDPNDGNFVLDGLCFSNHTATPGLTEYKKAIEPVQALSLEDGSSVRIINRYDFKTLNHLKCSWYILDGRSSPVASGDAHIRQNLKPHSEALMHSPALARTFEQGSYLNLRFELLQRTSWAQHGHVVATGQFLLDRPPSLQQLHDLNIRANPAPVTARLMKPTVLLVEAASGIKWEFDLSTGDISSFKRPDQPDTNILTQPLSFDIYRAQTDNDRGCDFGRNWDYRRLHQAKHHRETRVDWDEEENSVWVKVLGRIAPPVLNWWLHVLVMYTFAADHVRIKVVAQPKGQLLPRAWGRFGLVTAVAGCDRQFGRWDLSVDDLITDYEFPQENGNRTDVRFVEFKAKPSGEDENRPARRLLRAQFGDFEGASFSALPYSVKDLDKSKHPYELHERRRDDTAVHLDWYHHGLGTGSCGPETLPQYTLDAQRLFNVEIMLD